MLEGYPGATPYRGALTRGEMLALAVCAISKPLSRARETGAPPLPGPRLPRRGAVDSLAYGSGPLCLCMAL
jgi:hypothetical protein